MVILGSRRGKSDHGQVTFGYSYCWPPPIMAGGVTIPALGRLLLAQFCTLDGHIVSAQLGGWVIGLVHTTSWHTAPSPPNPAVNTAPHRGALRAGPAAG